MNTDIDVDKVIKLYESGISSREIAKDFNCSSGKILYHLNKNNIKIKPNGWYQNPRVGEKHPGWKGYKEIPGKFWGTLTREAKARNKVFNISLEYIWNLWINQDRKCAISGIPLILHYNADKRTASLDRIRNNEGYIEGNVEWVHKKINLMKHRYKKEEFIELCKIIAEYNK